MHADARPESDDEWAARVTRAVRSGSREALAEIYDRCAEDVVRSVERVTRRDESFALDCLQEMFMRLAAHPPVVDSHAAFMAWMRVAALNVARNMIVSEQRRKATECGRTRHAPTLSPQSSISSTKRSARSCAFAMSKACAFGPSRR